ncbi:unnamed protein product [Pieris macdunnoughi]|uniref:Uncharacterized protein n=1 Tax=Pieris macdunnoughi TaxID=345717 RepID=A0A821T861_9NEOP|nr:unnamed protein product [Pieris macdunnoughi]
MKSKHSRNIRHNDVYSQSNIFLSMSGLQQGIRCGYRRRDVVAGGGRIAIASESKQAGGVSPGPLKSYYPHLTPGPCHTRHLSVRRYGDGPGRA